MMRNKFHPVFGFLLILIVGFGLSWTVVQPVRAEVAQFPTDEQALLSALAEYMTATGETSDWQLGEIERSGKFAATIAQAGESVSDYEDFVLLMARQDDAGNWTAVAPGVVENSIYNQWLADMPDLLVNGFEKSYYYLYDETPSSIYSSRSIPLHHFPWAITREALLTQKDGSYHTHQLDFVMRSIDDIYASKPGLVVFVKDSSGVGGCDIDLWAWANMVVVQHSATEFTWYVHLKQNSATVNVGDLIGYGTKIGEQGNTGFACGTTGIHLHFMASNEVPSGWPDPNVPNYAPWPPSGSIYPLDFIESSYAALVAGDDYVSQNASPPGACNETPTQVNLYDNTYCNGSLYSANTTGLIDLVASGADARLESIEIPADWSASLYLNQNELGAKTCLNGSDSMLWDNLFSDGERVANNVLWLRLYDEADCPYPNELGITLYPEINFGGTPLWGVAGEIASNEPGFQVGSIYVPNEHSVMIYDEDDLAGNSVCLSGSALDLSQLTDWPGGPVESLSLMAGDQCVPPVQPVPQPELIKPEHDGVAYMENPEACWQVDKGTFVFNVEIFSGNTFDDSSGWIKETCWTSQELVGRTGIYYWRVQAKNKYGDIGDWSDTYKFTLAEDTIEPTAAFVNLEEGKEVIRPRANMIVAADDGESGVARVHFFAWYDDGTGYDWHYQGVDEDGSNGWKMVWNLVPVESDDAAAWAYAEDYGGNFTSVYIAGLEVRNSSGSGNGTDYKNPPGSGVDGEVDTSGPDPLENPPEMPGHSDAPLESPEIIEQAPIEEPVEEIVQPGPTAVETPVFNEAYYLPDRVELCWEADLEDQTLRYRVAVQGKMDLTSRWMVDRCWKPDGLEFGSGEYTWQVQVSNLDGGKSGWSAAGSFQLLEDDIAPEVRILSPMVGEKVTDEVVIWLEAVDGESGLDMVQVLAWYDTGEGPEWHPVSEGILFDREYKVLWDVRNIPAQKIQLWVYVADQAGNFGWSTLEDLQLGFDSSNELSGAERYPKSIKDTVENSRGQ